MTPHFGFYEVNPGLCEINLYYGHNQRLPITTVASIVDAQILCDNLNRTIPILKEMV